MSLQAPFVPDVIPVSIGNNVVQNQTPAQFNALFPSTHKTPTKDFSIHVNGHTLAFKANVPFTYDAALLAVLTAANAPIV